MGNEIIKDRITSIVKTGIYYMKNPQNYLIEIKKEIKESIIDISNNISFISSRPSSHINDSFSYNKNISPINYSTMTIDIDLQNDLIITFGKLDFYYSFISFSPFCIVTLTKFIKKKNNYAEKILFKNQKISFNNIICKNGFCLIGFNRNNNIIPFNIIYPISSISENKLREVGVNNYSNLLKPEKIFLGSPIFYELSEGKIHIVGIISEINNKNEDKPEFEIKFFTEDDILNLINMEYLFSNEEILLKDNIDYKKIKRLDLSYDDLNDNEFQLITEHISNLENLNLSHLNFEIFPIKDFVKLKMNNLKILNLSSNKIYEISTLAKANFRYLEELYIDNNGIMNESIIKFFEVCKWNNTIKLLSINNNINIRDSGFNKCNFLNIEKLYCENTGITNMSVISFIKKFDKLIELNIKNNYLTHSLYSETNLNKIKQLEINFLNEQEQFNNYKTKTLKNNYINNNLIISSQIFMNLKNEKELRPYIDINNIIKNDNLYHNNDDILSFESLLENDFKYEKYCINSIFALFPDKSLNLITSFIISSNCILTLSDNIYCKEKGGMVKQIISCYSNQIINDYHIFIKGNIGIICFTHNHFNEWFGICNYNFTENENNNNLNIHNYDNNNINIINTGNNNKINIDNNENNININNIKDENLNFYFYTSLNYNEKICNTEIHSIKINKKEDLNIKCLKNHNLINCFGSPLTIKKDNKIYSIGLLNKNYKFYFFSKKDIDFIIYNIYLIKLSNYLYTPYDIETKLETLELPQKEISNSDFIKFLQLDLIKIKKIDVSFNYIDERSCIFFSERNFNTLKILNLNNNFIRNEGFKILCKNLNKEIEILKVSNNFITSKGIIYLLQANYSFNLQKLNISRNKIENKGIQYLCKGNFPNLKILNISFTEINKVCIEFLKEFLKKVKIEKLNLKGNKITKKDDKENYLKGKINKLILD